MYMQRFSDGCKILKQVSKREEKTKKKQEIMKKKRAEKRLSFPCRVKNIANVNNNGLC